MTNSLSIRKTYSQGKVLHQRLYEELKQLDQQKEFIGCGNEFLPNRDWWVMTDCGKIVAYCGSAYRQRVCIFVRAWVCEKYRGKGIQRRMIYIRVKAAKQANCKVCVTYTLVDNTPSANNLFRTGFRLFIPEYQYAGKGHLYFRRLLDR